MAYYESGTPKMTRPTLATFYDEWGMPLSSEGQYTAGPGHAAKLAAERDWKIAQEKEKGYYQNPNQMILSPGDAASAGDAQARRQGEQQDDMFSKLMAMLSGSSSSSSSSGGVWTPGSSLVGGDMAMGMGSGMGGGSQPARYGGSGKEIANSRIPQGPQHGGGGGPQYGPKDAPTHGGMDGNPSGGGFSQAFNPQAATDRFVQGQSAPTPNGSTGQLGTSGGQGVRTQAPTTMSNRHQGSTDEVLRMQRAQQSQMLDSKNWSTGMKQDTAAAQANGRYSIGPNGALVAPPNPAGGLTAGGPTTGGVGGATGGGAGAGGGTGGASGGSGLPFGQAFEQSLYSAFNKPGIDPEPIINKGTEEIAMGENNALTQLGNRAANQGIEGGAVQAGNREVLTDFAGKRANLARDVRVEAAKNAEDQRMSALNTAGGYLGRISDNQRQDRNQMMQMMMSQMQAQQNRQPDYSGLASQAGQRSTFANILAPGGGKSGSGASGGSTFPSGMSMGGGAGTMYNPGGGLQSVTHNAANNRRATEGAAQPVRGSGLPPSMENDQIAGGGGSQPTGGGGLVSGPNKNKSLKQLKDEGWNF